MKQYDPKLNLQPPTKNTVIDSDNISDVTEPGATTILTKQGHKTKTTLENTINLQIQTRTSIQSSPR